MGKKGRRNFWLLFSAAMLLLTIAGCRRWGDTVPESSDPPQVLTIPDERIPITQTISKIIPDETFWTQGAEKSERGTERSTLPDEAILPTQTMPPVQQKRAPTPGRK